jgi:hypothetical protein
MKTWQLAFLVLPLSVFAQSGCAPSEAPVEITADEGGQTLDGVWEYLVDGVSGISSYSDGYYVHFWTPDGIEPGADGLTAEQKIEVFDGMLLTAGTYSLSGDTCTNQILFSIDPGEVGTSFRWVLEIEGDTLGWNVIDENGEVTMSGRSLRIR